MSYCVNCGVELGGSEKKCILCGCEVINPCKTNKSDDIIAPYPKRSDIETVKDNRKFYSIFISVFLVLPVLISLFLNIVYFDKILWSVYVIGAFLFIWIAVVPPILFKKISSYFFLFVDYVSLIIILFVIENLFFSYNWFIPLGLPIITIVWLMSELNLILINKGRVKDFAIPGIVLIEIGILSYFIDLLINIHFYELKFISWSVFVLIPTLIIGILFMMIEKNEKIKEEIIKRFHF